MATAGYKVRIGQVEIEVPTMQDVHALLKQYGGPLAKGAAGTAGADNSDSGAALSKDMVILKAFVDAGRTGIKATDLGAKLGAKGKSTYPAARKWAVRVKLADTDSDANDPFERCIIGTNRAVRLKAALLDIAASLLKGAGKDSA